MRIVFDTSVLVAAFTTRGLCHELFEICLEQHQLIVSEIILKELRLALKEKIRMPAGKVRAIQTFIEKNCLVEDVSPIDIKSCRDPNDLHVIGLAVKSKAKFIVSGDNDLLDLKSYKSCKIINVRQLAVLLMVF